MRAYYIQQGLNKWAKRATLKNLRAQFQKSTQEIGKKSYAFRNLGKENGGIKEFESYI